jgi:ComF family protein
VASAAAAPYGTICGWCREALPEFGVCRSAGYYDGKLKKCIHLYKYGDHPELSRPLGRVVVESLDGEIAWENYQGIVPVPLHRRRLRERGFNQSLLLAGEVERRRAVPVLSGVLEKGRDTPSQSTLKRTERLKNLRGAFILVKRGVIEGKKLLLLDDVYTTGATVTECAGVLLKGGAAGVDVVTLAR